MPILRLLVAMILTALLSLLLTPADFRIAAKLGAIDVPRDARRMHKRPVPRLGGLSVFFSFLLLTLLYSSGIASDLFYAWSGAILVVLIGVLDDEMSLSPGLKFAIQCVAAYVGTLGGNTFRALTLGGRSLSLGVFSLPLTLLFIVTLINAHNFIDGLDGLCAGVSFSESLSLGLICLASSPAYAAVAFILGGAILGFMPYNTRGARLFLGDTGSTFLGYMLAFLAVGSVKSIPVLMLIFAFPLTDLCFAVLRRLATGKNPLLPDRSHLHHILADRVGAYRASKILCFSSALAAALAVIVGT